MTKPAKSELGRELERKHLSKEDYAPSIGWTPIKTASLIDVMACLRNVPTKQMKTFGDMLCRFMDWVSYLCTNATRVDFVFDTYIDGSIKDSERIRRGKSSSI